MTTELATNGRTTAEPGGRRHHTLTDVEMMAKNASESRMFGMDRAQAFTLMLLAQSEGLDPIQALKRYHVIKGRPAMRADAMQAEFQRHGGKITWVKRTAEECVAIAWHPAHHPEKLTFTETLDDLVKRKVAMVYDEDKKEWRIKDMYVKFPRQMLRARVISELVRTIDPGIIVGVYTPEELDDSGDDGALDAESRVIIERPEGPVLVHEPTNERRSETISDAKAWLRRALVRANDSVRNQFVIEQKVDKFEPIANEHQVIHAMISRWIRDGVIDEHEILKPNGKRDPAKVGAAYQVAWHQDPGEVKAGIRTYLVGKAMEAFRDAGIEPPDDLDIVATDDDESPETADGD